jgi:hypothetical protein
MSFEMPKFRITVLKRTINQDLIDEYLAGGRVRADIGGLGRVSASLPARVTGVYFESSRLLRFFHLLDV